MKSTFRSALLVSLCAAGVAVAAQGCGGSNDGSGFDGSGDGGSGGGEGGGGGGGGGGLGGGGLSGEGGASSDGGTGASCATATSTASRTPVYMLITLDGSGSMSQNRDGSTSQKWAAVVPALDAIFDEVLTEADPAFAIGLTVFSDTHDESAGCKGSGFNAYCKGPYPNKNDVPINDVTKAQHDALRARIDSTNPFSGTPTQQAMNGGYGELTSYTPAAPVPEGGKRVHVIMTDGVPTDGTFTAANAASIAATQLTDGTTTFVIGIGDFPSTSLIDYDPAFVGAIAKAGGAAPAGCNPSENSDVNKVCHFQITPGTKTAAALTQDFIAAINTIRGEIASCTYTLDKSSGTIDPTKVNVIYTDGSGASHTFVQDPTNGWTYDNPTAPTAVILHGTDCTTVKGDPKGKIAIQLGCLTKTVN